MTNAQTQYIYIYLFLFIHKSPRWDGADSGFQPPGQPVGAPASRLVGSSQLPVCYGDDLPINGILWNFNGIQWDLIVIQWDINDIPAGNLTILT